MKISSLLSILCTKLYYTPALPFFSLKGGQSNFSPPVLSLIFFSTLVWQVNAQDPHFSLFNRAPLQLNPALTGYMPNNTNDRLSLQFRNQWRKFLGNQSFHTIGASYDRRWCSNNQDEFFSGGISLLGDQVGTSQFRTTIVKLSGSYLRSLGDQLYVSAGLEVGLINYLIKEDDLQFDTQYNGFNGFNPNLPSLENFVNASAVIPDLGIGLLLYKVFNRTTGNFVAVGGALQHINKPAFSFLSNENLPDSELRMKIVFHANAHLRLGKTYGISPKLLFWKQDAYLQIIAGAHYNIFIDDFNDYQLSFGGAMRLARHAENGLRHSDALILSAGFDTGRISLTFAYDLNISTLAEVSNNVGALELTLTYFFNDNFRCANVFCPRY